ncbi:hypothetical protein WJX82_003214 [Trebouxia sp. C0006]
MASSPRASNQAEWQRPPQRTPHSHIAYLPSGAFHFPLPTGRPTAHSGEFESGLSRSAQPPPPPPRRVLCHAQAATSLTGQAHTSLYRGVSLQPAGHQAAGYYGALPPSSQQQQQQWLLPVQGQNLPFGGHQAWVQTAYRQQPYSQQQPMAMPQQMAEHQPALQQPGVAPQMRTHSAPSPQYAHARPQLWQQPSVQHVSQQTASQRVFSHQKSSLNGNARPFVGSAKASAPTSIAAEVHSEASGSGVSNHTSPSTSSPLPDAATGRLDQRRVDKHLNASARAYVPQKSLERNAQEESQPDPELHLHVATQDSATAVKSGLQPATGFESFRHLLFPEFTASRGQPMPKSAGQHPLCQKLLEQAPEQLPELAEASGVAGCSGGKSVSPRLVSSGDAESVPPVAMHKVPLATDDVPAPALSTRAPTSPASTEGVPCVSSQKVPVGPTPSSSTKAGILNEGSVGSVTEVHSEASGSNVSSSRTSPGTSSPLQGAATDAESVSSRLVSSDDAEAAAEGVPYVRVQKGPVGSDDGSTMLPSSKADVLTEGPVDESAASFMLGAYRAQTSSGAASMSVAAPRAGITGLSSPSGSFVAPVGDAQSEPSSPPGSTKGIAGAQSGGNPRPRSSTGKPESAAAAATAAKSVIGHISSNGMPSQATTSAEDHLSSFTAAAEKGTGAVRALEAESKSRVSDISQGGVVESPAQSPSSPPLHALVEGEKNARPTLSSLPQKTEVNNHAESASNPPLDVLSGREERNLAAVKKMCSRWTVSSSRVPS